MWGHRSNNSKKIYIDTMKPSMQWRKILELMVKKCKIDKNNKNYKFKN